MPVISLFLGNNNLNNYVSFCSRSFCFSTSSFFFPVGHCFRGWWKINLKVFDVISCLNKNLITHFVWEKRCTIETFSIDRILKILWRNHAQNVHQKLNYISKLHCKTINGMINYSNFNCPFASAKRGKVDKILQKFEYFQNEKSFLDEIKSIFHSFWKAINNKVQK